MKTRTYIVILAMLLLFSGAGIVFISPWSTTGNKFEKLLPEKPETADRILIKSGYDPVAFYFESGEWKFEDEVLNEKAVQSLLLAAGNLRLKAIIPGNELNVVNQVVDIAFLKGNRELGRFLFTHNELGSFIFHDEMEKAYGVELIGYEHLPLEKIFSANPDHFRNHLLINLLPSEVKRLEIVPIEGKAFRAEQDTSYNVSVSDFYSGEDVTHLVSEKKIRMLFSYFNGIRYVEQAAQEEIATGSFPDTQLASVAVTDFSGNEYKLSVYHWYRPGEADPDMFRALVLFNNIATPLKVDYLYLDLIIRGLEKYMID